jgi:heme-degrading monooxygenase HmoA
MYAVIFQAQIKAIDQAYSETAARMRELAIKEYGCLGFKSVCEEHLEIAISYWETLEDIRQWKQNAEHLEAQQQGKSKWYESYHVQVVEIVREYEQGK